MTERSVFPGEPQSVFVERERSNAGDLVSVATILLKNRRCPWRCLYCDLWKDALDFTVPHGAIPAQIDFALTELRETCRQVKLYNAGSFFDRAAIPPDDFPAIAERVRRFERVIVECHPALVGAPAARFRDLLKGPTLEIAMGLEVADDAILQRMNKRMTLAMFQRAAEFLRSNGIAMRAFVIVKPPSVRSEEQAIDLAVRSAKFAFDCGATAVSLIPARFGTEELEALAARGEFAPPTLATIESAFDDALALHRERVFVDLWNFELFKKCEHCFQQRRRRLKTINDSQSPIPRIHCACEFHSTTPAI